MAEPWVKPLFIAVRAAGYVVTEEIIQRMVGTAPMHYMLALQEWDDGCRTTLIKHFLEQEEAEDGQSDNNPPTPRRGASYGGEFDHESEDVADVGCGVSEGEGGGVAFGDSGRQSKH